MIFKSINSISSKNDKAFFIEKINIYIRLIQVYAYKYHYNLPTVIEPNINIIDELINIGVIDNELEVQTLKKVLGDSLYYDFISCVDFFLSNKMPTSSFMYKLRNKSRQELQRKEKTIDKPTLADFFCGAGGLSLGFVQAGYRIVFANENQDVCCETYKYNHPELPSDKIYEGNIESIIDNIKDLISEDVDVVVGGPPCQGFSSANKQRIIDDPRNHLYKYYIKAIENICPKFVVMENVKGMLSVAQQVVEDFKSIKAQKNGITYSYTVSCQILNSQNFSVAQSRERLIYIAIRNDIAESRHLSPLKIFEDIHSNCKNNTIYNLEEALQFIKPLNAPRIKGLTNIDDDSSGKKIDVNSFDSNGNKYLELINKGKQIDFTFNHKARYCSDVNYEIFKRLGQGEDATDPKIADIMPYANRNHCFKDKYFKLIANKPCRTITAHLRMDCLSHIHPYQIRSITPREAARIQSFPDDYLFLGAYLKTYMQIGNAVPVLMANTIAMILKKYL